MPLFDAPRMEPRRSWSDYSLDYKAFFVWEVSLMALMILREAPIVRDIPTAIYGGALAAWFLALSSVAVARRFRENWHWPGLSGRDWLGAGGAAILAGLFFFVFSRGLLPLSRATAPMVLFALSICVFSILHVLKLVQFTEDEFKQSCGDAAAQAPPEEEADEPSDPKWKRAVRAGYSVFFLLAWLEAMGSFYLHQSYVREGSRSPTATQTEAFNEHGRLIYVTREQKTIDDILSTGMMIGIPGAILGGLFLHFVVGVSIFSNLPQVRGLFGKDPQS